MSLCNIWLESARALVAVDTIGLSDGKAVERSKIFLIPHASVVLAARGQHLFFVNLAFHAMLADGASSFDELADRMNELFSILVERAREAVPAERHGEMGCEVSMVGWSDRSASMGGISYVFSDLDHPIQVLPMEFRGGCACRIAPAVSPVPPLESAAAMIDLARRQVAHVAEFHPENLPMGGRLILAEVLRGSVSMTDAGLI